MSEATVHVFILDSPQLTLVEHIVGRRPIGDIVIVYPDDMSDFPDTVKERYDNLMIGVKVIRSLANNFDNVLSGILTALNDTKYIGRQLEFSISCGSTVMTMAGCVAAIIVKATIISALEENLPELYQIEPSEMVSLSKRKRDILELIAKDEVPFMQPDIERVLCIPKSAVSRHVRDMVRAGYITRKRTGKKYAIALTDLGRIVLHHKLLRKKSVWGNRDDSQSPSHKESPFSMAKDK